jgi:hypothetical protein
MDDPWKSLENDARARFMSSLRRAGVLIAGFLVVALALRVGDESLASAVLGIFLGVMVGVTSSGMADAIREIYRTLTKDDNGVRLILVSVIGVVALFLYFHLISERSQRGLGSLLEIFHKHPSYASAFGVTAVPSFLVTLWWLARRRRTAMSKMSSKEHGKKRDRNKTRRRSSDRLGEM